MVRAKSREGTKITEAQRALRKVGGRIRKAQEALDETQRARDDAIRNADDAGMTRRAIADDVGVSYGRVEQILKRR